MVYRSIMANFYTFRVAVCCTCLAFCYFTEKPSLLSYFRASVVASCSCFAVVIIHNKIIYPLYTSPLIEIPLIKRKSWKEVFGLLPPPLYLYGMDNIPNDGFLRRVDTLNQEVIILTTPKLAAEFLQQRAQDFEKLPAIRRAMTDMLGNGLISSEGEHHKIQRKALTPAFAFRTIKELYPFFWSKANDIVSLLKSEMGPQSSAGLSTTVIDMDDWSGRVALDMVSEASFGSSFDGLRMPFNSLNRWYRAAFLVDEKTRPLFLLSLLTHPKLVNCLPLRKVKEKLEGIRGVRTWLRTLIEERKKEIYANVDDLDFFEKRGHRDIISAVMKAGMLNTDGLVEQSLTFLGAGHETSSTALTWGIHELSQPEHRHYQSALRNEIREFLPSTNSNTPITSELLESLPLLNAISQEILRLHAPVVTVGRIAIRDTVIGGRHIPEGTAVRISPWAMGRSRKLWGEDAGVFRPERWIELKERELPGGERAREDNLLHNITFGHGPHSCIGKGFALAENKTLLAALVGNFEFRQVGDKHVDPESVYGITGKILRLLVEAKPVEGW